MTIAIVYSTVTNVILRTVIPDNAEEEALIKNGTWPSVRPGETVVLIDNSTLPKNNLGNTIHAFDHSIPEVLKQHGIELNPPTRLAVFDATGDPTQCPYVEGVMGDIALYRPAGKVVVMHPEVGDGWTLDAQAKTLQAPAIPLKVKPLPIQLEPTNIAIPDDVAVALTPIDEPIP